MLNVAAAESNEHPLEYCTDLIEKSLDDVRLFTVTGKVIQVVGTIVKAVIPGVKVGELVRMVDPQRGFELKAEVVGIQKEVAFLTPLGDLQGLSATTQVIPTGQTHRVRVGDALLGRVLDGLGNPLDGLPVPETRQSYPVYGQPPNPMIRSTIDRPIQLGVRALDSLLTCGEGQRMGIFAAAGVGKSTMLATLMRNCDADVSVLACIGERGREVREFIDKDLGAEGLERSVLVVSTSDRPAMERLKAAHVATAIAEYFRDQGKRVLLMMDSVTRFARAQREIGLSAGEPPTRRGFPPSVFAALPKLMERAGRSDKGSITALYTVLVEGDDMSEPVADETRSILDGHIILSRKLAAANHFPAIDVLESVSRVFSAVTKPHHQQAAAKVRNLLAKYAEVEMLIKLGEYKSGNDPVTDEAVRKIERIQAFLQQATHDQTTFDDAIERLEQLAD
ncbi:type III secretion system ATPase SctN [Roseiconus lacunae]|uniref:type III secretion system ATPase SctN n=1 Tax=Roseiconus lacunae TaxID=2605694 RepID=UPI001E484BC1|nr:type III secretion system ATPase SctN [Roseiconus lacunae]MCD0457873.1 type III secretion system ATPase SctN [Roseiconus lacunae]